MANRLDEVLSGKEGNYILPFLWQRGESEEVIRDEIARIDEAGIRAFCVEARPHPDFLGPKWWADMDILLEVAKKLGMRVWVFDDDHYPTGHAAGKMEQAPLELRRAFLREQHLDVLGPKRKACFLLKPFMVSFFQNPAVGTYLEAVVAVRRDAQKNQLTGEYVDLSDQIQGDYIYWDVPVGYWRIFFVISTSDGGSQRHKDYINPLLAKSVKVLIDTVYEPFFDHYGKEFGHTFAGFFSDEPGFYNDNLQPYDYASSVGKAGVDLPWGSDLLERLCSETGLHCRSLLPLLWHEGGEETKKIRFAYMDLVSRLYAENFTKQIGDWCRAHNVEYIGHVIEDNGAHDHLGCGAGHYFRALWDQDMAGLDVVLWQLVPGFDQGYFTNVSGQGDGTFYHYGLAKMASSLGHIDPKKRGRTVCELFGAYGWTEGLKLMKWLTDHMLVRGVNHFIPHAFSQAEFPDFDCPPHFYARGHNPQFRYYRELNTYTNRLCHLLCGAHVASVAVLYHAEADWLGQSMPFHQPVKELMQRQIDCDVLPADVLFDSVEVTDGTLCVEKEKFQALVIPYSQVLLTRIISRLVELAKEGLPIIFVDGLPESTLEKTHARKDEILNDLDNQKDIKVVALDRLAQFIRDQGWYEIEASNQQPYLRLLHIRHTNMDVYLFTNENPLDALETQIFIHYQNGHIARYDAFQNRLIKMDVTQMKKGMSFPLHLSPYESLLLAVGEGVEETGFPESPPLATDDFSSEMDLSDPWEVSIATAEEYPRFTPWQSVPQLRDLSQVDALSNFSGTFRYETIFAWEKAGSTAFLDLGEAYETVEVWLNGNRVGIRICPPYLFVLPDLHRGENYLLVEVTNTLVRQQQDYLSRFSILEPSGLLGPVKIFTY